MAIQSTFYTPDGSSLSYPQTKHIPSKQYVRVLLLIADTNTWIGLDESEYDLVYNSIVLRDIINPITYGGIEVRIADNQNELADSLSTIAIVASIASEIATVANVSGNVTTVADSIASVNTTAGSIASVNSVAANASNINTVAGNTDNVNAVVANANNINTVAADLLEPISEINTVANDIVNINILAQAIQSGGVSGSGGGGQFVGNSVIKGVQFMAHTTNETLVIPTGTNAFSIESLVLEDGASIVVPNGSVYKVL